MKLLIYGDVVGKLGRAGVKLTLPEWKKEFSPDVVIANIENIAHGKGIGKAQIDELAAAGVDVFTGGNHSVDGKDADKILNDETIAILRPINMAREIPGRGFLLYDKKNLGAPLLVMNAVGQVNMKQHFDSPFYALDYLLNEQDSKTVYKILDWHAEATSEKEIMGWYLDGRVSLVFGTPTHIPSAGARIFPDGTGYISDIGMVGPHNSLIGVDVPSSIDRFKLQVARAMDVVENGPIEVNAIFVELESDGKTVDIRHLRKIIGNYIL